MALRTMAIIQGLPGIEATVESQGKALPEYDDDGEWRIEGITIAADKRTSTFVQCVSDTPFQIRVSIKVPLPACDFLAFSVYIDGQSVTKRVIHYTGLPSSFCIDRSVQRLNAREIIRRDFKFARIRKIDDADSHRVTNDAKAVPEIGEIVVRVYRARKEAAVREQRRFRTLNDSPTEIAEKALKGQALSHGVAFGEENREASRKKTKRTVFIDGKQNPIAVFRFKYRSREALQQELIIPRSPSPDMVIGPLNPRSTNASNNDLSSEERLAQLQREIDLIKAEVKIKEENAESSERGQKRGADEPPSCGRAYKTSRKRDGRVVVDLTDD